jgi:hypothetical protein
MATIFDVITVTCFIGLVIAFYQFSDREVRMLAYFMLPAIMFAVANQLGNTGHIYVGSALVVAGIAFAVFMLGR